MIFLILQFYALHDVFYTSPYSDTTFPITALKHFSLTFRIAIHVFPYHNLHELESCQSFSVIVYIIYLYLAHTRYRSLHPSSWYVFNPVNAAPDGRAVRRWRTHHQRAPRECLLIWWTGVWGNYPEIPDSSIWGLTPSDTQHRPRSFRAAPQPPSTSATRE